MTKIDLETPEGVFRALFTETGLARLDFPEYSPPAGPANTGKVPARWVNATRRAVAAVLKGRPAGELPPLDLSAGTDFQRQVWEALSTIPSGETRSYAELAQALGRSGSARAVGQACGRNPIPLLIPCHRVLAADKRLGGFSGGLHWKRRLLEREGVAWREVG